MILSINIKNKKVIFGLYSEKENKITANISLNRGFCTGKKVVDDIFSFFKNWCVDLDIEPSDIKCVGLSISASITDDKKGIASGAEKFGWKNIKIAKYFEKVFQTYCFLVNDARAELIGEIWRAKNLQKKDIVYYVFGSKIDGGLFLNGKIHGGVNNKANDFGHGSFDFSNDICECGLVGCLETVFSSDVLNKKIKEHIKNNSDSCLATCFENKWETNYLISVTKIAEKGCEDAINILRLLTKPIANHMGLMIYALDPSMIMIGWANRVIEKPITDAIKFNWKKIIGKTRFNRIVIKSIKKSGMSTLYGATYVALREHGNVIINR